MIGVGSVGRGQIPDGDAIGESAHGHGGQGNVRLLRTVDGFAGDEVGQAKLIFCVIEAVICADFLHHPTGDGIHGGADTGENGHIAGVAAVIVLGVAVVQRAVKKDC